jgi:hypothetical protein
MPTSSGCVAPSGRRHPAWNGWPGRGKGEHPGARMVNGARLNRGRKAADRAREWGSITVSRPQKGGPMRTLIAFLLVGLLAGCSSGADKPAATTTTQPTYSITGTFKLLGLEDDQVGDSDFGTGTYTVDDSGNCSGTGGYDDVQEGVQVAVADEAGTVIATGYLLTGEQTGDGCLFRFKIDDIRPAKFYKIAVGRRGELSFSHAEMEAQNWFVEFTLGD